MGASTEQLAEQREAALKLEIDRLSTTISDQERKVCDLIVMSGLPVRTAMLEGGYAASTVAHRGAKWFINKPKCKMYMESLTELHVGSAIGGIKSQFLRLEQAVRIALSAVMRIAEYGKKDSDQLRAAKIILDMAQGLLLSALPQKGTDWNALVADLFAEARANAAKTIEVEEDDADDRE